VRSVAFRPTVQGMKQLVWRKRTQWPMLAAALIFLVAYSIEVIGNLSARQSVVYDWIIWGSWAIFIIDYIANLILAERRLHWFVRNLHEVVILALPVLRPLRLLRLVSLVRVMQNFAGQAFRGRVVSYVLGAAVLLTYVGALAVLDAEQDVSGSNIRNFGDAIWWSAVTITTVGYGDHYPITLVGRLVAVGLMIGGIAVLGVVTAALASWLIEQVGDRTTRAADDAEAATRTELARVAAQLDRLTALMEANVPAISNAAGTESGAVGTV
jgi:voltage-gated potassium channel